MSYSVIIKRKGLATEITYGTYRTIKEARKVRSVAGRERPARIVHVTKRTYPREIKP